MLQTQAQSSLDRSPYVGSYPDVPHADAIALLSLRAGDRVAFGELFDRYAQLLYRLCRRRCLTPTQAEDAMSVVFLEAWRCRDRMTLVEGSLRPWLFGVATNVLRHQARTLRRHDAALQRFHAGTPRSVADIADDIVEEQATATDAAIALTALGQLTPRERDIAELCLVEGLALSTAATALGISEGAARYRLGRARSRLRRALRRSGEESADGRPSGHQLDEPETRAAGTSVGESWIS